MGTAWFIAPKNVSNVEALLKFAERRGIDICVADTNYADLPVLNWNDITELIKNGSILIVTNKPLLYGNKIWFVN